MHLRAVTFRLALALPALALGAGPAWAHAGRPPEPHDLWGAWSPEPAVLLGIGLSAWLYARGVGRLWARAGVGRGVRRWQFGAFVAGLLVLFVALVSPLDALGSALFSAHMVQHEVLILAAAPLLVLGVPLIPFLWALPQRWRRRLGRWAKARPVRSAWRALTHPVSAWVLHAAALWIWHAPALYQATLRSEAVHVAQHASFLGTALLFWWVLLHSGGRMGYGVGVLYVFTTAVYGSMLGALLTFSPTPWYPAYAGSVEAWGLTLLEDQQLGGLIMWVPAGVVYVGAALALFAAWLRSVEDRVRRAEGRRAVRAAAGLALMLLVAGCGEGEFEQSILDPRGVQAQEVEWLWWVMFWLATLVWVVVVGFLGYGLFRARKRSPEELQERDPRNVRAVAAATGATVLILVLTFGLNLATDRHSEPEGGADLVVDVIGYRFWWEVRYPGADPAGAVVSANEIHVPAGRTVLFRVRSADVIHSFWVPNLHGKIDMMPGRTNHIWVEATEPGTYRGQCAEFCGLQHANMAFMVVVHEPEEFEAWLARERLPAPEPVEPLARAGREVFVGSACAECHTVRGTPADGRDGPDLTHIASRLTLAAGILPNTKGHLGGWIANPQAIKPGNNMPYVPLEAEEFRALLHYLQTLR